MHKYSAFALVTTALLVPACRPTVEVKAPQEPITINMNIKIEHEVRIKVDKCSRQIVIYSDGEKNNV